MNGITPEEIERLKKHREKNFDVEIACERDVFGTTVVVSITGNGNQWTSMSLESIKEIDAVINELEKGKKLFETDL